MKAVFDPSELRRTLEGNVGFEWALAFPFEEAHRLRGQSGWANADLNQAVQCILVGFDDPAKRLVRRALEWLTIAVREDEPHRHDPPDYVRARRHFDLAQCACLLDGRRDSENYKLFLEHRWRYFASKGALDKVGVSLAIVEHLDSGDDRATLDLLLRTGIGPPSSFNAIRTDAQMAYVLCRKRLAEAYVDENVDGALAAFPGRNVNAWLIDGHHIHAALWMKVAHGGDYESCPPHQAVRRIYDYLPKIAPLDVAK